MRRYNAQDREQLIKEYEASGQTRQAFCEERDLKLGTFHGWFQSSPSATARRSKKEKKMPPAFAEVKVAEANRAPIEIGLPGGPRLGIYLNGDQGELIKLCRGILRC